MFIVTDDGFFDWHFQVDDDGIVAVKDRDLGVEVISFVDDPTNAISSADLVNGEFLTTDKNLKLSPMVMFP